MSGKLQESVRHDANQTDAEDVPGNDGDEREDATAKHEKPSDNPPAEGNDPSLGAGKPLRR